LHQERGQERDPGAKPGQQRQGDAAVPLVRRRAAVDAAVRHEDLARVPPVVQRLALQHHNTAVLHHRRVEEEKHDHNGHNNGPVNFLRKSDLRECVLFKWYGLWRVLDDTREYWWAYAVELVYSIAVGGLGGIQVHGDAGCRSVAVCLLVVHVAFAVVYGTCGRFTTRRSPCGAARLWWWACRWPLP
jgi:hypothetical protein